MKDIAQVILVLLLGGWLVVGLLITMARDGCFPEACAAWRRLRWSFWNLQLARAESRLADAEHDAVKIRIRLLNINAEGK